jgi:hypothetical protein
MADDTRFQGDWNANKGYLQLMIDYMAMGGQFCIQEQTWQEYKTCRELYKLTKGVIDEKITLQAKEDLDSIRVMLRPKNIDTRTMEGQSIAAYKVEDAEAKLEEVEVAIISGVHARGLILPKKEKAKGVKQLWEEYDLNDNNTNETS